MSKTIDDLIVNCMNELGYMVTALLSALINVNAR